MRHFIEEKGKPVDPFDFIKPSSSRSEEVQEGGGPDEIDKAMYELESVRSAQGAPALNIVNGTMPPPVLPHGMHAMAPPQGHYAVPPNWNQASPFFPGAAGLPPM